ncbi:PhzF family phenazine biosynthesis protein [Actinoplanes sp. LDG1-06]|uniref:PhzF family phenazine biosynthesis protein n=1 Tax=Paractinoplanes ovalisporus TaxID=2810368 RepID=A0ABS2AR34_9ACTN|nr:PhzF family phenazine biosynthesis protein [Actinoplanes ovalisporus]MBM2622276.1 PhzF family phenazine biosynthesis protein [Actinoplanes ovalisporus]
MSGVAYEIVDVFTDRPFAGNPLAVVYDATDLGTDQMHTLAREFNLAETVFVLPPTDPAATYRARIFTPEAELPFAGHPSVGAAVTSSRRGLFPPGEVVQECGAGLLPITVTSSGSATVTGGTPRLGPPLDPGPLLALAGLTPDDFAGAPPRSAGCGLDWIFLPVRREALADVRIDTPAAQRAGVTELSVFSWSESSSEAHARVFVPGAAVPEDPATGSAALGLGLWLVASEWLPGDGTSSYQVHQGLEMKRPSLLTCTVTAAAGVATSATVGGHVMPIARGEIAVPPFVG